MIMRPRASSTSGGCTRPFTMRRTPIACVLALFLAPGALRAQQRATSNPAPARDAIRALEQEWLTHSDSATLDRVLADDFQHVVGPGQLITKSEHIAWAVSHPRPCTRHPSFESLTIRIYGDAAVVTGTVATVDDSAHTVSRNSFTDVFVNREHRWRAVSAEETPIVTAPRP